MMFFWDSGSILEVICKMIHLTCVKVPTGSPSCGGDAMVYVIIIINDDNIHYKAPFLSRAHSTWLKPAKLAHSFLFCSCVCFCLCGPFNCISFHKLSRQLFAFSLCSSGLVSNLLVLSTIYLFMKVSLSPDVILCSWLGLKHQLTN